MDIIFKKPPNLNNLCLVYGGTVQRRQANTTFLLDSKSIKRLFKHYNFTGKFVFYDGKLALHPGESKKHADILKFIDPRKKDSADVIGAIFEYRYCENLSGFEYFITLNMGSSFGFPSRDEMKKVGDHIVKIIKSHKPEAQVEMYIDRYEGMFEVSIRF